MNSDKIPSCTSIVGFSNMLNPNLRFILNTEKSGGEKSKRRGDNQKKIITYVDFLLFQFAEFESEIHFKLKYDWRGRGEGSEKIVQKNLITHQINFLILELRDSKDEINFAPKYR